MSKLTLTIIEKTTTLKKLKMRKSILALAACALISGAMFTGCNTPAAKVANAQDNVVQANHDLEKANQEYRADIENYRKAESERIAANDRSIADLKASMEKSKKAAKADYKKKVALLEEKNADMKRKLADYKEDGKDKWATFKTEFSHDMDELGQAFKDLTVKNVK